MEMRMVFPVGCTWFPLIIMKQTCQTGGPWAASGPFKYFDSPWTFKTYFKYGQTLLFVNNYIFDRIRLEQPVFKLGKSNIIFINSIMHIWFVKTLFAFATSTRMWNTQQINNISLQTHVFPWYLPACVRPRSTTTGRSYLDRRSTTSGIYKNTALHIRLSRYKRFRIHFSRLLTK
jgi:hypothetical protein